MPSHCIFISRKLLLLSITKRLSRRNNALLVLSSSDINSSNCLPVTTVKGDLIFINLSILVNMGGNPKPQPVRNEPVILVIYESRIAIQ